MMMWVVMIGQGVEVVVCWVHRSHHGGLKVGPLSVLPFTLVSVLVATKGLRCREVPTTIVALKLPTTFTTSSSSAIVDVCVFGGGFEVVAIARVGVVGGGGGGRVEVDAEEADGGGSGGGGGLSGGGGGRSGANEGELREGVNIHEVMSLIKRICWC